mgnify:CR=1 FL=1
MSGFECLPLADLVLDDKMRGNQDDDEVWNLNLDQIEPDSGRILEKIRVPPNKLGPSTYPFTAGTVLYSKLRPYLNKVVVADEAGVATTELVPLRCNPEKVLPSPESVTRSLQSPCFPIIINELSTNNHAPSRCKRLKWLTQSSSLSRSCPTT